MTISNQASPETETQEEAERRFWEFVERTAKQVESWPAWKREGWYVLDNPETSRARSKGESE